MPYLRHLSTSVDLITPPEEIRAGFVALALEKSRQATPFVEQARALKVSAMRAKYPNDLLEIEGIQTALLTAAGFSEKATNHTNETDKTSAIQGFIEKFLEPAGTNFIEELVYRFLLTRGDSLGGSMRNVAGKLGERKFTRALISALTLTETTYQWLTAFANEDLSPDLFFIGAIIADSMAQEIWSQLEEGTLKNAAHLTNPDQVASLANWPVDL
ncbi:MAG: hypothetical protein OYL97_19995 [Candidatus Poribacteria bacterium]|nr:hypothetical protein [Candidatus Poribacteria bacterium]MDE0469341.1 hypothetical protein [Candidatus Poribacteria bacterium]